MIAHSSPVPETLGQRIARLRAQRGWTQQTLAERLAASRVAVSHFEAGLAWPSERTVVLLAGLFRIEPHELVANTTYPHAKAERLPLAACRYTEAEMQLALLQRDLAWAERDGATALAALRVTWRPTLQALLQNTYDQEEQRILAKAFALLD